MLEQPTQSDRFILSWTLLTTLAWFLLPAPVYFLSYVVVPYGDYISTDEPLPISTAILLLLGFGALVGWLQYIPLRRHMPRAWLWPLATIAGTLLGGLLAIQLRVENFFVSYMIAGMVVVTAQGLSLVRSPTGILRWLFYHAICIVVTVVLGTIGMFGSLALVTILPSTNGLPPVFDPVVVNILMGMIMVPYGLIFGFTTAWVVDGVIKVRPESATLPDDLTIAQKKA